MKERFDKSKTKDLFTVANIHDKLARLYEEERWPKFGLLLDLTVRFYCFEPSSHNLSILDGPFYVVNNQVLKDEVRLTESEFRTLLIFARYKFEYPKKMLKTSHLRHCELLKFLEMNENCDQK